MSIKTHLILPATSMVAHVVDIAAFLLEIKLDPVVETDDLFRSTRLTDKHVLKPRRVVSVWNEGMNKVIARCPT